MPLVRKARFFWVYPLAIWLFVTAQMTAISLRWGIVFVALGEALRWWANGYVGHLKVNATQPSRGDAKIGRLITGGPYAFVRHPLYLGTFLIGLGFCVMVNNAWVAIVALALFLILYRAKMREEETTLRGEWGEDFTRYERAAPRWLPTGRRYDRRTGSWSWQGIHASKEPKTVIWVAVGVILMCFREEWGQHEAWLTHHGPKHLALLGLLIVLVCSDIAYELMRRVQRRQPNAVS